MTTTPIIQTTVETKPSKEEVERSLTNLALGLVRRVAEHNIMTADDNCELEYAYDAAGHLAELVKLLDENPEIDASNQMLRIADSEVSRLIVDMHEFMDYQDADPDLPLNLIEGYRKVAERLDGNTDWLEPIKADFEARVEHDEDED